jgi:hypothetical protein
MSANRLGSILGSVRVLAIRILLIQCIHGIPLLATILFSKYASCALQERLKSITEMVHAIYRRIDFPASEIAINTTTDWLAQLAYLLAYGSVEWLIITFFAGLLAMNFNAKWAWLAWLVGIYLIACVGFYVILFLVLSGM